MVYENTLKLTFIISITIHVFLLYQLPRLDTLKLNKSMQEIKVSYYKLQSLKIKSDNTKPLMVKNPIKQNLIPIKRGALPSPVSRDASTFFKKFETTQKNQMAIKQLHPVKKISFPEVKSENRIKSPKYNNYYHIVRDKIRRHAYDNYLKYDTGEVYLVFVVSNDGSLKQAKIMDEKTKADNYLKAVALQSVEDAAPYPHFPEGLSYPELSFNVIISFEISE